MNLLGPLLAGVRGAENGTAEIYKRGTSTRATWYATFEADGANSSGANLILDANGGIEAYTDELVDVVVRNSLGVEIRRFTEGYSAPHVEVRSVGHTGTDYVTAQQGSGRPTTLQKVLDRVDDSFGGGTLDWQVLLDGQPFTLVEALSRVAGPPFYNVKATTYGAKGDGTTDDTAAIQAAINAANATDGGTVFFPAGLYILTAVLTVPKDVSLLGAGPGSTGSGGTTELRQNTAAARVMELQDSDAFSMRTVRNLSMRHAAASTQACIAFTGTHVAPTHVLDCHLGSTVDNGTLVLMSGSGNGEFHRCVFTMGANGAGPSTATAISGSATASHLGVHGCRFVAPAVSYSPTLGIIENSTTHTVVTDCFFDMAAMTAGTANAIGSIVASKSTVALGNYISNPVSGTAYMFLLGAVVEGWRFYEDFNFPDPAVGGSALYNPTSFTGNATPDWKGFSLGSRERRQTYIADNSASLQLNALEFGIIFLDRSDAAAQTLTTNFVVPNGSFTLVTRNNTGGAGATITPSTASFRPLTATYAIATAGNIDVRRFRGIDIVSSLRWTSDSTPANNF